MVILVGLVALTLVYAALTAGLILLLRRLGIPASGAIVLGFLIFGGLSGLLAAWAWPLDSSVYCNIYAVLAGDWVCRAAIEYLGGSRSANAHETIPWLLRTPQVYVPVSVLLSGLAGLPIQWLYRRRP